MISVIANTLIYILGDNDTNNQHNCLICGSKYFVRGKNLSFEVMNYPHIKGKRPIKQLPLTACTSIMYSKEELRHFLNGLNLFQIEKPFSN
jgi:hypothetical protein